MVNELKMVIWINKRQNQQVNAQVTRVICVPVGRVDL